MRHLYAIFLFTLLSFVAATPTIVVTTGMLTDIVRAVAGGEATVVQLVPNSTDAHHYRPTAGDIHRLSTANAIVYSGFGLEDQLETVLVALASRTTVVAASELVLPSADDPHVWLDPTTWAQVPAALATALAPHVGNPEQALVRAEEHAAVLLALHEWALASFATVPVEHPVLATQHDAFGHFGRAYGVEFISVQGFSTETEPSIADIRRVADDVVARGIPVLFLEDGLTERTMVAVAEAVQARGASVVLGEPLYADTLGADGTFAGTYLGIMVHNVRAVVTALGGTPLPLPAALQELP